MLNAILLLQVIAGPVPLDQSALVNAGDLAADAIVVGDDAKRLSFVLAIDQSGKALDCSIRSSSGDGDIDRQVCDALLRKARFRPARNEAGAAVAGQYQGASILYRRPEGYQMPRLLNPGQLPSDKDFAKIVDRRSRPLSTSYVVDVDDKGVPVGCTTTQSSGHSGFDRRTCDVMVNRVRFKPASKAGVAIRGLYFGRSDLTS